jgi:predicted regulator of Ras-like GTPase activity (Roadblock/LC7/MglB family)
MSISQSQKEKLEAILEKLRYATNAKTVALVSRDGNLLYSNVPMGSKGVEFAAVSAVIFAGLQQIFSTSRYGMTDRIIAESYSHKLIMMECGEASVLVVVIDVHTDVGRVTDYMENARTDIKSILG